MPRGLNKVLLIGNLGRDPEMRYTPDGTPVTTFSIASSRMWVTSGGDRREVTEWFNIVAWRRLAEICHQHLSQGSRVYIEGRLQTRSWDDADGLRHQRVEVVANEMIKLDGASRHTNLDDLHVSHDTSHDSQYDTQHEAHQETHQKVHEGDNADSASADGGAQSPHLEQGDSPTFEDTPDDGPSEDDRSQRAYQIEG